MSEPKPLPAAPALPIWTCDWKEAKDLTVGKPFRVECRGDISVGFAEGPVDVVFAKKEDTYSLVVLKTEEAAADHVKFLVTGYKPGKFAPEYARFVQGANGFEVTKPTWEIASVLNPNEQPKPFESFGPWSLEFPHWILISLAIVGAVLAAFVWRFVRRFQQRRKMLAELSLHKTAISPVNQFYRDARQLRRRLNGAKSVEDLQKISSELNREFRLYVLRQFLIPTLDWSDPQIMGDLRKRHRKVFRQASEPLKKTLRELTRLTNKGTPLLPDVEQVHRMSLDAVERLESARVASQNQKGRPA